MSGRVGVCRSATTGNASGRRRLDALGKMLAQRIAVGLDQGSAAAFRSGMPVVPVLALGPGEIPPKRLRHALELRDALAELQTAEAGVTSAIEFWRLRTDGNVDELL